MDDPDASTNPKPTKRPRDLYHDTPEARAIKNRDFIGSLKFSKPLWKLRQQQSREKCPKCGKRRLYYCYDCLEVVHTESHPPPLHLPIKVNVILHPGEHVGKSTSLVAATISPDVRIIRYPEFPENLKPEETLVLYPSAHSVPLSQVTNLHSYKNVVFVDSTWQQSKSISRDVRVTKFKHVRIESQVSLFWRFQNYDPSYLATVEAIYYFLREYITQVHCQNDDPKPWYKGEVDDLLFYFINQYIAIQQNYTEKEEGKNFTTRHFGDYVLSSTSWDDIVGKPLSSDENAASK